MMPLPPSLYLGDVGHMRHRPVRHALRYRMLSILADIDGPHRQASGIRGFSFDRRDLVSQYAADHGRGNGSLRDWVRETLRRQGIRLRPGRIQLLASPRVLGFVFNPVSVYFCHAFDGRLAAVIFEVSNFHGGRCAYAFPVAPDATMPLRFACPKRFFVSPFNPVDGEYRFRLDRDGAAYRLGIRLYRDGRCTMGAVHRAQRRELTSATLLRAQLARPFNTLATVGAILFEALKLRLKGLRTHAPRRGSIDTLPRGL
jgi:hypothetical protein